MNNQEKIKQLLEAIQQESARSRRDKPKTKSLPLRTFVNRKLIKEKRTRITILVLRKLDAVL